MPSPANTCTDTYNNDKAKWWTFCTGANVQNCGNGHETQTLYPLLENKQTWGMDGMKFASSGWKDTVADVCYWKLEVAKEKYNSETKINIKFTKVGAGMSFYIYGANGELENKISVLSGQGEKDKIYSLDAQYDMIIVAKPLGAADTDFEFEYYLEGEMMDWVTKFYAAQFKDPKNDAYEIMVLLLGILAIFLYFCLVYFVIGMYKLFCKENKQQQQRGGDDSEMASFNSILAQKAQEKYGDFENPEQFEKIDKKLKNRQANQLSQSYLDQN